MSECIDLPTITLPTLPAPLEIPQLPTVTFGGGEFCCTIKVPVFAPKLPIQIPATIAAPVIAVLNVQMKIMETFINELMKLPRCPAE